MKGCLVVEPPMVAEMAATVAGHFACRCCHKMLQYFTRQTVLLRPGRLSASSHDSRRDSVTSWKPPRSLVAQHSKAEGIHCSWNFCFISGCD